MVAALAVALIGTAMLSAAPGLPKALTDSITESARKDAASALAADGRTGCDGVCAGVGLQVGGLGGLWGAQPAPGFTIFDTGFSGAEPTLGVKPNGNVVYIQVGLNTLRRIASAGTGWEEIGPSYTNLASFDPMMLYDPVVDRLYVSHLTIECSLLAWTDIPETVSASTLAVTNWKASPHACAVPGIDHQKLDSGPTSLATGILNENRMLYLAYSQAGGDAVVAKSVDGGLTWIHGIAIPSSQRSNTLLWPTGPVTADPAGTYVYLPSHTPSNDLRVARSTNEGLTWTVKVAATGAGVEGHAVDPEVAVDEAGNAYVVWYNDVDHQIYFAYSDDNGFSWSAAVQVSDGADTQSTVYPAIVAKSDGEFDVVYYGTDDSNVGPNDCADSGANRCVWYVHMAQVTNARDSATRTITRTQVTPDSDPVQIGRICTEGLDCTGTPDGRNLLDFLDIEVDSDGNAHIAYTDGCIGGCGSSTTGQTDGERGAYAEQTSGSTI